MSGKVCKISGIVGVIILFVLCLTLIFYAVAKHEEATLLEVCWDNGVARYVEGAEINDGSCDRPEKLIWPIEDIPLTVSTIDEDGRVLGLVEERRQAVDAAMVDINMQLGFRMFTPSSGLRDSSVIVLIGEVFEVQWHNKGVLAVAGHHMSKGRMLCSVGISPKVGSLRLEYLAAHHELLHCAGLAHDVDNRQSAMFPLTFDDTSGQLRAARVTDMDKETLKTLYHTEEDDNELPESQSWTMD